MKDECYEDFKEGLFDDQIWLNFVPLYFQKVCILKHSGYNIAYWNLHDRMIEKMDGVYLVNNEYPLVFFHFSGFSIHAPESLSKHQSRYVPANLPIACKEICAIYSDELVRNKHQDFIKLTCAYAPKSKLNRFLSKVLPSFSQKK